MSNNRFIKEELERKYGKGCMFEKAHIEEQIDKINRNRKIRIKTFRKFKEERTYSRKKMKEQEKFISVHHLRHRSERRRYLNRKLYKHK